MADAMLGMGLALLSASLFIAFFRRTRIPDVLLLIFVGLAIGPVTGWVTAADFGKTGAAASTIALTVILFESGLSLELEALKRSAGLTLALTAGGFVTTTAVAAAFGVFVLGLTPILAVATGVIIGGTSSAVVIPLVKQLNLGEVVTTSLALESAITDVLCIVIAGASLQAAASGSASVGAVALGVLLSFGKAALVGTAAAFVLLFLIRQVRALPNAMVGIVAAALVVYGLAERLGASGAIASLAFGFTIANRDDLGISRLAGFAHVENLREPRYVKMFLGDLIFILKTFFFVFLGISISIGNARGIALTVAVVLAAYGLRAVVVRFAAPPSATRQEAALMSVMAPKGLAAAVLAGVPAQMGLPGADVIQQFVYEVVLVSIILTSVAVPLLPVGPFKKAAMRFFVRQVDTEAAPVEVAV